MTTFNTGNPLGSADPRDLYDNAENFDQAVNAEADSFTDRLGMPRKTWHAMEEEFVAAQADKQQRFNLLLANSGYEYLADYAAGIEITEYNQVLRDAAGELWRAAATTALPYTTDGTGLPEGGAFIAIGDADIRNDLAAGVGAGKGALLVRGSVIYVDTIADLQALDTSELVDGQAVRISSSSRRGDFSWHPGDYSSEVANDPLMGVWVAPNGTDGSDGCWVRDLQPTGNRVTPQMYGAVTNEDNKVYSNCSAQQFQAAIDSPFSVYVPAGYYYISETIFIEKEKNIEFEGSLLAQRGTVWAAEFRYEDSHARVYSDQNIDFFEIIRHNVNIKGGTFDSTGVEHHNKAIFHYNMNHPDVAIWYGSILDFSIEGNDETLGELGNGTYGILVSGDAPQRQYGYIHGVKWRGTVHACRSAVHVMEPAPGYNTWGSRLDMDIYTRSCKQALVLHHYGLCEIKLDMQTGPYLHTEEKEWAQVEIHSRQNTLRMYGWDASGTQNSSTGWWRPYYFLENHDRLLKVMGYTRVAFRKTSPKSTFAVHGSPVMNGALGQMRTRGRIVSSTGNDDSGVIIPELHSLAWGLPEKSESYHAKCYDGSGVDIENLTYDSETASIPESNKISLSRGHNLFHEQNSVEAFEYYTNSPSLRWDEGDQTDDHYLEIKAYGIPMSYANRVWVSLGQTGRAHVKKIQVIFLNSAGTTVYENKTIETGGVHGDLVNQHITYSIPVALDHYARRFILRLIGQDGLVSSGVVIHDIGFASSNWGYGEGAYVSRYSPDTKYNSLEFRKGRLRLQDSSWDGDTPFMLGNYTLWVDSSEKLRIKDGAPNSDDDGSIVGNYIRRKKEDIQSKSTVDIDFIRGSYLTDNGNVIKTSDPLDVLSINRPTPKWVLGPDRKYKEVPPDTVPREWDIITGEPLGFRAEASATNFFPFSGTMEETDFNKVKAVDFSNEYHFGFPFAKILANNIDSDHGINADCQEAGDNATQWLVVKKVGNTKRIRIGSRGGGHISTSSDSIDFDFDSESVSRISGTGVYTKVVKVPGDYFIIEWWEIGIRGHRVLRENWTGGYLKVYDFHDPTGGGIYVAGGMVVTGSIPTSYIPTNGTPATRAADELYIDTNSFVSKFGTSTYIHLDLGREGTGETWEDLPNGQVVIDFNGLHYRKAITSDSNSANWNRLTSVDTIGPDPEDRELLLGFSVSENSEKISTSVNGVYSEQEIDTFIYGDGLITIGSNTISTIWVKRIQCFPLVISENDYTKLTTILPDMEL